MKTQLFVRRPFDVEAVQVTKENMEEVAKWCDGRVQHTATREGPVAYIKVRVHRPLGVRQTQAFIGDWILYSTGYKVYLDEAFHASFEAVDKDPTLFDTEEAQKV